MDGNKKKISIVSALNKLVRPKGEFTILDDPTVAVLESNKPADVAAKKKDNTKKIER